MIRARPAANQWMSCSAATFRAAPLPVALLICGPVAGGLARPLLSVALGLLLLAAGGCHPGVAWEFRSFEDAHELAQKRGRLTFVYFRSWYLVDCTNFEENVLRVPEVLLQTRGMVCVPLDFDWDQPLAQRWGLTKVPAFTLVGPDGDVLIRKQAPITREELLAAFREAKAMLATSTEPVPDVVPVPLLPP